MFVLGLAMDIEVAQTLRRALPSNSTTELAEIAVANTGEVTGRCLRANGPIEKNQLTIRIPISHAVKGKTLELLLNHLGTNIEQLPATGRGVPMTPMYKKILVLLHGSSTTSSEESIFALQEYIATLPKSFEHMPSYWNKTQIDRLGPLLSPTLRNFIQRMKNEVDYAHFDLSPIVNYLIENNLYPSSTKKVWSIDYLKWAYCCLTSRTFDLTPINFNEESTADETATMEEHGLVPFMDLMNHAQTPADATLMVNVETIDQVVYATARATRDLKKSEELCFSYRTEGDALKFLFNYGFVPKDAKDIFYLMVDFPNENSEGVDNLLSKALKSLGLPATKTIAIPMTDEDPLPQLYIWALRVREMHLDVERREECLGNFVSGQPLRLLQNHEQNVWNKIGQDLSKSYEFYTEEEVAEKKESSSSNNSSGVDASEIEYLTRVRDAAARILEKCMTQFVEYTSGGGE